MRRTVVVLAVAGLLATACSSSTDSDGSPADAESVDSSSAVGFVDAATFTARQNDYLEFATTELSEGSILNVLNHATRAQRDDSFEADLSTVTPDVFAEPLDEIANWVDTTDFDVLYLLNLLYAAEDQLPAQTVEAIDDALLGYEYWYTEPTPEGQVDNKYYWSENHRIIFAVDEYLAGQRHPEATFINDGRTGAEHKADATERIIEWLDEKVRFGFTEWHSDVYYQKDFTPLLSLVEWADDPDLADRAAMVLDLFAFDLALHLHDGNLGATHGRSYMKDKSTATQQDVFGLAKLLFADTEVEYVSTGDAGASLFARAEKYQLPAVIERIATSTEPIIDKERMGVPLDNNAELDDPPEEPYGISFDDPANIDFWWERGAQTVWPTVPLTMKTLTEYDLWESQFFSAFIPLRDAVNDDPIAGRDFVAGLSEQLAFGFLPEVSTTTYRTDDVMLSTALDHRQGDFSDQAHVWQATLSEDAIVFTTHPKNEPFLGEDSFPDADGYWTGSGSLPRSAQVDSMSISLYSPTFATVAQDDTGPLAMFTYLEATHAFFPTEKFDEVVIDDSGWVFGRQGDGYVGIWSHRPAAFVDPVPDDIFTNGLTEPFDLRADGGPDNVWITEVGDTDTHGSFEEFRAGLVAATVDVRARPARADGLPGGFDVIYTSPTLGNVTFGQDGPLTVDGTEVPLRHDARYDNPFAQVPFDSQRYEISDDEGSLTLDFSSSTRTAN
ncbi:MAG TPA: hypothetical protein VMW08_15710 [Acidimicrobiales bacterium]|nr:hypothetical protein [Acidimicrobiales bacterium]